MEWIFLIIFIMQPQWVRHSNFGVLSYRDSVSTITVDNFGNIYVTGNSARMPYNKDYLTIKYDSLGNIIWKKRYDDGKKESVKAIFVDDAGNVYITGISNGDYLTIKYSPNGEILWSARYGEGIYNEPVSICVDNYGNVYVSGKSYDSITKYDYLTIKYNPKGELLWVRRYNGSDDNNDVPSSMLIDNSGNLYLTGKSYNYGNYDFVTIKYTPNGEISWIANFDMGFDEEANDIAIDDSGYLYVIGRPYYIVKYNSEGQEIWYLSTMGPYKTIAIDDSGYIYGVGKYYEKIYIIKCNSQGEILWWQFYPTQTSWWEATYMALHSGNIYIFDYYAYDSLIIIKYNSQGTLVWAKTYSSPGIITLDIPGGLSVSNSGSIYVSFTGDYHGNNKGDYFVIKYDSDGQIIWISQYSGEKVYSWDEASGIAVSNSGNVYITGRSYGGHIIRWDYATIKYNSNGDEIWVRRYGSYGDDMATAIAVDNSENVYVTGVTTRVEEGNIYYDYATIKYNPQGEIEWIRKYTSSAYWWNIPTNIFANNSYVYVTGVSKGDYATIKYDTYGNLLWVSRYSTGGYDVPSSMFVDNLGYVYVTGEGNKNYLTVKHEPFMGEILWAKEYDSGLYDEATSIYVDTSGNVYVTGRSYINLLNSDIVTIKYNSNGEEIWISRYDGEENSYDEASSIFVDDSGNVYVAGQSYRDSDSSSDYVVIKYDLYGQIKWVKKYHGIGNSYDAATVAFLDNFGNLYVTGRSYCLCNQTDDFVTIKYNSQGQEMWIERYNGPQNSHDAPVSLLLDNFGNLYVGGTSYFSTGGSTYTLIKYNLTDIKEDLKIFPLTLNLKVYPNPFKDYLLIKYNLSKDSHINISIYNILGQKIMTLLNKKKKSGDYEIKFYPKNLSKGVYFLKFKTGNLNRVEKIIFFPL